MKRLIEHDVFKTRCYFVERLLATEKFEKWPVGTIENYYRQYFGRAYDGSIEKDIQNIVTHLYLSGGIEVGLSAGTGETRIWRRR